MFNLVTSQPVAKSAVMPESGRTVSQTLFKYFVRDTLFSFFVSFLFFFCVFFVNQLLLMAQEILAKHVPLFQVLLLG